MFHRGSKSHRELHRSDRSGWLRAAVLGSDDAIVSTASLMIGVAAASASTNQILVAGVAGLVAGAMSMAAGEYVSVSSQRDAELADVAREKGELASEPQAELAELAGIYKRRGLDSALAMKVAEQLTAHDESGGAHARRAGNRGELHGAPAASRLGVRAQLRHLRARPHRRPAHRARAVPHQHHRRAPRGSLAALGAFGGHLGGASRGRAALRVTIGGALAMGVTAAIGRLLGVSVG